MGLPNSKSVRSTGGRLLLLNVTVVWPIVQFWGEFTHFEWICLDDNTHEQIAKGSVCWVRRGHRGGCYYKSEQLTFVRDVFASEDLLKLISV